MEALLLAVKYISIHAPRTGSDRQRKIRDFISPRFQSTLPARGATERTMALANCQTDFNPRSPHGERPVVTAEENAEAVISIHAPRTGSDTGKNRHETGRIISIHAPRTGSDPAGVRLQYCHAISIHAPRTGSDVLSPLQLASTSYISIHAPRTGSDRASSSVASTM